MVDKFLRFLFVAVALIDLALGFVILVAPGMLARMIELAVPESFYVWVLGLLQIGLSLAYFVASGDPARYANHVALAGVMRFAMATLLIVTGYRMKLILLIVLGVAEVLIGVSHLVFRARLARRTSS